MFTDAETRRTAALKAQEDELGKFRLTKELAVARAEIKALSKVENGEFPCQSEQKETTLPILSDKNDLQDYLTAQASAASIVCSAQTLKIDVNSVADPLAYMFSPWILPESQPFRWWRCAKSVG